MIRLINQKLLVLFFLLPLCSFSQILTKEEMLADWDYLVASIRNSYAQYELRENITDIKFDAYFSRKRDYIKNHNISDGEFTYLIKSALTFTQDEHSYLTRPIYIRQVYDSLVLKEKNVTKADSSRSDYFFYANRTFVNKNIKSQYVQKQYLNYSKGKYYTSLPIENGKEVIPYGTEIVEINNQNIDEIVRQNLDNLYCKWDFEFSKYYSERVWLAHSLIFKSDSLRLTVKLNNEEKEVVFSASSKTKYKKAPFVQRFVNTVSYLKKENILYVRLVGMGGDIDGLLKMIAKYKKKPIEKVVIDIRGNTGGSDLFWLKILTQIIEGELDYSSVNLAFRNKNDIDLFYRDIADNQGFSSVKLPFLEKTYYTSLGFEKELREYLKGDENSLQYSGKIYLLQDKNIFSSAVSLSSLALYSPQIISIGEANGGIGGVGEEPLFFVLPNSLLYYCLDASLGFTNIESERDYFNKVEMPIFCRQKDVFERESKNWTTYSKRFLRKKDPLFRFVLSLK